MCACGLVHACGERLQRVCVPVSLCVSVCAYTSTYRGCRGLAMASAQNLDRWEPGPRGPEREACSLPAALSPCPAEQRCFCTTFGTNPRPCPQSSGRLPPPGSQKLPLCQLGWPPPRMALGGRKCWNVSCWVRAPGSQSPTLSDPPSNVRHPTSSTHWGDHLVAGGCWCGCRVASICHHTPHRWPEPSLSPELAPNMSF